MLSATDSYGSETNKSLQSCRVTHRRSCCSAQSDHNHKDMSLDLLLTSVAKQGHKVPEDVHQQKRLLAGLSHLHLNGLQLTALQSLRMCPKLQVLYIYDNFLKSIASIVSNKLLTHVYCHNNQLSSLQGLQHLPSVRKLYAENNCLSRIDCLHQARHLEELHVSNQQPQAAAAGDEVTMRCFLDHTQWQQHLQEAAALPAAGACNSPSTMWQQQQRETTTTELVLCDDGRKVQHCNTPMVCEAPFMDPSSPVACSPDTTSTTRCGGRHAHANDYTAAVAQTLPGNLGISLAGNAFEVTFESASLQAIAGSLRVLSAANCGIVDPSPLAVLTNVRVLDLGGNDIASIRVLQPVLDNMSKLQELDLRDNPCVHSIVKYRQSIILAAADSLEQLDGEVIRSAHREFVRALHGRMKCATTRQQLPGRLCQHQGPPSVLGLHSSVKGGKCLSEQRCVAAVQQPWAANPCHSSMSHMDSEEPRHGVTAASAGRQPHASRGHVAQARATLPQGHRVTLQLATSRQACRYADSRTPRQQPTAVAGFKLQYKNQPKLEMSNSRQKQRGNVLGTC